jgi:hypothetical protein
MTPNLEHVFFFLQDGSRSAFQRCKHCSHSGMCLCTVFLSRPFWTWCKLDTDHWVCRFSSLTVQRHERCFSVVVSVSWCTVLEFCLWFCPSSLFSSLWKGGMMMSISAMGDTAYPVEILMSGAIWRVLLLSGPARRFLCTSSSSRRPSHHPKAKTILLNP